MRSGSEDRSDNSMPASELSNRYHYGGSVTDAELTASQLRSRYDMFRGAQNPPITRMHSMPTYDDERLSASRQAYHRRDRSASDIISSQRQNQLSSSNSALSMQLLHRSVSAPDVDASLHPFHQSPSSQQSVPQRFHSAEEVVIEPMMESAGSPVSQWGKRRRRRRKEDSNSIPEEGSGGMPDDEDDDEKHRHDSMTQGILNSLAFTTALQRRNRCRKSTRLIILASVSIICVIFLHQFVYLLLTSYLDYASAPSHSAHSMWVKSTLLPFISFPSFAWFVSNRPSTEVISYHYQRAMSSIASTTKRSNNPSQLSSITPIVTPLSDDDVFVNHTAQPVTSACGYIGCVGDRVAIDVTKTGAPFRRWVEMSLHSSLPQACTARILLFAHSASITGSGVNEQQRALRDSASKQAAVRNYRKRVYLLPDGWAGGAAFWIEESHPAFIHSNSSSSQQGACPYTFGAYVSQDSLSLAHTAPCSVAIRDYCELSHELDSMASLPTYVTDHPTKFAHINKYPPRPRRVLGCTSIRPSHTQQAANQMLPKGYVMAQSSAFVNDMCPDPSILPHPPDRYTFPECSARLFALVTVMKDDGVDEEKHWIQAQRDLSLVGICPPPSLYTWLPDAITHPDCDICIAEKLRTNMNSHSPQLSTQGMELFYEAQQSCATTRTSQSARPTDPEGVFLSGSCPSVRVVRWVPSQDESFHDCQQAVDRWCRSQSILSRGSTSNDRVSETFLETGCSTQWRTEEEFAIVMDAQRWASSQGFCPSPDGIKGLSFLTPTSSKAASRKVSSASYVWDLHLRPPKRSEFSSAYCSLL